MLPQAPGMIVVEIAEEDETDPFATWLLGTAENGWAAWETEEFTLCHPVWLLFCSTRPDWYKSAELCCRAWTKEELSKNAKEKITIRTLKTFKRFMFIPSSFNQPLYTPNVSLSPSTVIFLRWSLAFRSFQIDPRMKIFLSTINLMQKMFSVK